MPPGEATSIQLIILLLLIALAVALPARLLRVPYTLGLVVVGLVIGFFHLLPSIALTPSLVLFIFLPALLFEGAWSLDLRELLRNWLPISLLAVPGLAVSVVIVALLMHLAAGLPWSLAFLLGAIISPTDPVAVLALFRQMGLAPRLRVLIEGESLFNDGVAAAITQVVLVTVLASSTAATGAAGTPPAGSAASLNPGAISLQITLGFLLLVGGGLALGLVIGFLVSRLVRHVDDHLIETTITAVVAYGSYLLGEALHVSGILTVISAALVLGSYGREHGMSPATQEAVDSVWEFVAYLANSLLFLLMGLQISLLPPTDALVGIAWAVVSVVVGRALMIALCMPLYNLLAARWARRRAARQVDASPTPGPIPRRWGLILLASGLRGALSLALALALPLATPARQHLVIIVYGVVLVTLLGQGFGLRFLLPLLRRERAPGSSAPGEPA